MGYIGMCSPNGNGVLDILVINRVSILVILVSNRVWFCTHVLNLLFTEEATFLSFSIIRPSTKALHNVFNTGLV